MGIVKKEKTYKLVPCTNCNATGKIKGATCPKCKGTGKMKILHD